MDLDTLNKAQLKELVLQYEESRKRLAAVAKAARRSTLNNALLAKCLESLTEFDIKP